MRRTVLLLLMMLLVKQFAGGQVNITGTVTSTDDGLGLPGVFVVIKGSTTGTATDIDGKYSIQVPQGSTLVFSFVGMKSQEFVVTDKTVIDVAMSSDVFKMDEVIVAGVASATPKRKLSVSVNRVNSDELSAVPAASAATALQGKVAGITIVNSSGNPGQSAGIRLRGSTAMLGSQSPLIIVDGVMTEGDLADINVDDIADIQVVKGASASALYGSRAGSGVLVITTKRGNTAASGKTEIKFRNEFGISNLTREIKLAEHHAYRLSDDYKQPGYTKYYNVTYPEGYTGGGNPNITGTRIPDYDHYSDNPYSFVKNMQEEIFPSGNFYTNYLSVATNSEKVGALLSFENNRNSGIVFNKKGSERQNFRCNVDMNITDKIKLAVSSLYTQTSLDLPNGGETESDGGGASSIFSDVLYMNPDINLDMDAPDTMQLIKYYIKPDHWALGGNPKHALYYEDRQTKRSSLLQNYSLNYKISRSMDFDADYSFEKRHVFISRYDPPGYMGEDGSFNEGYSGRIGFTSLSQTFQSTLNINKIFGNLTTKGKLNYTFEDYTSDQFSAFGTEFLASGIRNLAGLRGKIVISSNEKRIAAINYSGILDLDYKGKYILSTLYRMDGSSLFGENNKWNPYYRISGAYRLNEDLRIAGIQELKLRAAVGTSGQRPGFSYQYETYTIYNGSLYPNTSGNKNLKPSETREIEIAVNTTFFDKFEVELIRSFNKTSDAFFPVPKSAVTGFPSSWENAGVLEGSSFEGTFSTQAIKTKNFEWRLNFSFDKVTQKVTELAVPSYSTGPEQAFYLKEGEPFGIMYGYKWLTSLNQMANQLPLNKTINDYTVNSDGYVIEKGTEGTINERPILLDGNKDGISDYVKIADMNPDFNLSFSTNITWNKLTFNMLWNWKNGGDIYNFTKQYLYLDQRSGDNDQFGKADYEKKTTDYYSFLYNARLANSHFVEDASYLKLRELSLYYTISSKKEGFFKEIKFGVLGRNLLTFSNYSGWDPEVASGDDLTNYVIDIFNYPNYRTITGSLELKF